MNKRCLGAVRVEMPFYKNIFCCSIFLVFFFKNIIVGFFSENIRAILSIYQNLIPLYKTGCFCRVASNLSELPRLEYIVRIDDRGKSVVRIFLDIYRKWKNLEQFRPKSLWIPYSEKSSWKFEDSTINPRYSYSYKKACSKKRVSSRHDPVVWPRRFSRFPRCVFPPSSGIEHTSVLGYCLFFTLTSQFILVPRAPTFVHSFAPRYAPRGGQAITGGRTCGGADGWTRWGILGTLRLG